MNHTVSICGRAGGGGGGEREKPKTSVLGVTDMNAMGYTEPTRFSVLLHDFLHFCPSVERNGLSHAVTDQYSFRLNTTITLCFTAHISERKKLKLNGVSSSTYEYTLLLLYVSRVMHYDLFQHKSSF